MNISRGILIITLLFSKIFSQFPIFLNPNDVSEKINFDSAVNTEYLLTISASSNTNWSQLNSESATLVVSINEEWDNYNQDVILYAGEDLHNYNTNLL